MHLKEVCLTQNQKTTTLKNLTMLDFFYETLCRKAHVNRMVSDEIIFG